MTTLSIDLESYSSVNLRDSGLYAYAEHPETEVLLFGYAFDDGPVEVIDLARGEVLPSDLVAALHDPNVLKTAWNAAFEMEVIRKKLLPAVPENWAEQWACSMVHSYYLGLPGSLDLAAKALGLEQQKDSKGTALIRYFSMPCRPTKSNGGRTRNLPHHDLDRWKLFIEYCRQDVIVERELRQRMQKIPLPERERRLWAIDQAINRAGVCLDETLVEHAVALDEQYQDQLLAEAEELTGLDNPNSVSQLKEWLLQAVGLEVESLNKKAVPALITVAGNETVERVLELRQEMAKTSIKKYQAMQRTACNDGRIRGLLQFYGAHTGRWAGRLVQVQNLPRNHMPDLDTARAVLRAGQYEAVELLWESVPDVLSQLIRTALVPAPGHRLIISDFSAIEARVLAWLAGEQWRLEVFKTHGKIYEASAAQMFGLPIEAVDKELRQKGKVAELALGYQGATGALKAMGALEMGLLEEDLPGLVEAWRTANPNISAFWQSVNNAAMDAVNYGSASVLIGPKANIPLQFSLESGFLKITLPSGRALYYARPRIEVDPRFGRPGLTFEGVNMGKWQRIRTYGGKLTENITQAVARDCLAEALFRLHEWVQGKGRVVFHVHDEVVLEVKHGFGSADEVAEIMGQPIEWAPGLPLGAEAFEAEYYRKD